MRLNLPTMAEINSRPRACPKGETRVEVRAKAIKAGDKAAEDFRRDVWARDKGLCRCCGRKVVRTLELRPEQGHVHHIAKRSKEPGLLTDTRNGVLVCALPCHQGLEHHEIEIVGTAGHMFTHNGKRYVDANGPLTFIKKGVAL